MMAVGSPIHVPHIAPGLPGYREAVDAAHEQLVKALVELYEKYKVCVCVCVCRELMEEVCLEVLCASEGWHGLWLCRARRAHATAASAEAVVRTQAGAVAHSARPHGLVGCETLNGG